MDAKDERDDGWVYIPRSDRQALQDKKNRLMAEALDLIQASVTIYPLPGAPEVGA